MSYTSRGNEVESEPFGLNFERHKPEAVELPKCSVRRGDKVRVLPPRGSTTKGDQQLWQVKAIRKGKKEADLELPDLEEAEAQTVALDDLVVVAEFGDTIYPGLIPTGKVSRGRGQALAHGHQWRELPCSESPDLDAPVQG